MCHYYNEIGRQYIRQMNQQKLKLIIGSLKERELLQLFESFCDMNLEVGKSIKKISYNCYEATLQHRSQSMNGYGKTQNDAFLSAVKNLLEKLASDARYHELLKEALKTLGDDPQGERLDKVRTMPDANERKTATVTRVIDSKPLMKSGKSIKEEIFESLNRDNIQLRTSLGSKQPLSRNTSFCALGIANRSQELNAAVERISYLESKLTAAQQENSYLKQRIQEKEKKREKQYQCRYSEPASFAAKTHQSQDQSEACLRDISASINNTQQVAHDKRTISYSINSSANASAFSSKTEAKVKIPKLNLQVLPNYHGKSNKSLNQSLLEVYEKKSRNGNV